MAYGSPTDYDMDSFLNLDQDFYSPSDSFAPTTGFSGLGSSTEHHEDNSNFPGPSHEYGRFKQQTGLPSGGMSSLNALDEMDTLNGSQMDTQSGLFDMEYDSRPMPVMTAFTPDNFQSNSGFVNPSAIQAWSSRSYPGVHTQAAESSTAQAMADRKRQDHGQQLMKQRQAHLTAEHAHRRSSGSSSRPGSDPAVEERISRLLDQMRHSSNASADAESAAVFSMEQEAARIQKMKKDEEDMDEDERLLASEAGKKLSSKERRQLRNKVSARAFRSRRKEYIGQLEGEVAGKQDENNQLRALNRQLQAQNQQLTQLTQTLLRHQAFSTFLEDMSNDPTIIAPLEQQNSRMEETEQQVYPDTIKEEPEAEQQQRNQHHQELEIQMSAMPPTRLDMSMLNLGSNHWGRNHAASNFQQSQVFSLTDLPQGPSMDELKPRDLGMTSNATLHSSTTGHTLHEKLPWFHLSDVAMADSSAGWR